MPAGGKSDGSDFRGGGLAGQGTAGPEGPKRSAREWRTAFPDIHFTVDELIAEDDKVVVRVTLRGTHLGPFQGLAPTGRTVVAGAVELALMQDGRIIGEGWHFLDELGLLHQLGLLPRHGSQQI